MGHPIEQIADIANTHMVSKELSASYRVVMELNRDQVVVYHFVRQKLATRALAALAGNCRH